MAKIILETNCLPIDRLTGQTVDLFLMKIVRAMLLHLKKIQLVHESESSSVGNNNSKTQNSVVRM